MGKIDHQPYVAANVKMAEFTPKACLLGILFALIFGATTSYLALKVGLTVSASIPIAVLAISFFKRFGRSTILENNIVQTIGSAGESIAAGVAFTVPALLFLAQGKEYFQYTQIFTLALVGGILGTLFMIPLRRTLIVQEHGRLLYPEGTACADVLAAGERGGNLATRVFYGIGIGALYKILMSIVGLWKEIPQYIFSRSSSLPNGRVAAEITPELLGVGYIIGIRISGILFAGGVLASLVLTPLISYFGSYLQVAVAPSTKLISEMSPMEIWSKYIRYIGAGAVTFSGIVTLLRTLPTIIQTIKKTVQSLRGGKETSTQEVSRLDLDLPLSIVFIGVLVLCIGMTFIPFLPVTLPSALLILLAGFIFVSVSSRIVGLIGSSSNPISGMTIATLIGTCLIFITKGWTQDVYQPVALCVGAIVAIAAANAGATSQDLKTGFLVGATPVKQQISIIIGAVASAFAIGFTMSLLNDNLGVGEITPEHPNPLPAPQAMLMSTIIKGMFDQNLPWSLVALGMGISFVLELCGVASLAFAVGSYLPISTTMPIFIGGLVKWFVRRKEVIKPEEAELENGALFSSGLIAGGALTGILIAVLLGTTVDGKPLMGKFNTQIGEHMGVPGDLISVACFLVLASMIYAFAVKKEESVGERK